jgi:HK97 family phage major capsid protein
MTTPAAAAGPVTTGSFQGAPFPVDVQAQIINLLIEGAPFAASLTRQPTDRSEIGWPVASPTGWAWLPEMQPFPQIDLGDDAYLVGVCKLGGLVDLSNESVSDNSINLTAGLSTVLQDSLSRDLDLGLLNGAGAPAPVGVIGVAAETAGASLFAAAMKARGELADAGGTATHLAASGAALAAADATTDSNGQLVFPNGIAAALGLTAVPVPALATPLVYSRPRCYLVIRNDVAVEWSRDYHFHLDATTMRIKGRFAAAIPAPGKSIRKLTISGAQAGSARKAG